MSDSDLSEQQTNDIYDIIIETAKKYKSDLVLLWYGQINGFTDKLINRFSHKSAVYRYYEYQLDNDFVPKFESDGYELIAKPYTSALLEDSINILESAFTPEYDTPGSFISDRDRLAHIFLNSHTYVFYLHDLPIGMYCINNGEIEFIGVAKQHQNKGYSKIILSHLINYVNKEKLGTIHLCTGITNTKAILLYEKFNFKRICENSRVQIEI